MKVVIADQKKRLVLPDARPGDAFCIEAAGPDQYHLRKLVIPAARPRPATPAAVKKAMRAAPLRPTTTWAELRRLTREP
jgi:hypothetical protein